MLCSGRLERERLVFVCCISIRVEGGGVVSRFSEEEIVPKVLDIIARRPGIRTSELIDEARKEMKPSGEDLEILNDRNDDKFSQKVRNIKSHNTIEDKVVTVGERNRQWYLKENNK